MQEKIDDIESAIDNLDTVITTLSKYEQFNKEVADLKIYKSALELDLDNLKEKQEQRTRSRTKRGSKRKYELRKTILQGGHINEHISKDK